MVCEDSTRNLLERILNDANEEPIALPLSFLKAITDNFSDVQKIGSGGFAVVYKGLLSNGTVAVKKLSQTLEVHEKEFNQEVDSLMRVKHKNIVRFLGYCADTQGKVWKYEGKNVMAEDRQRLLCFEFMPNGSLEKYITDGSGGLEWMTRYLIIKGICQGLYYLHQQKIVHLDLKPANILLDYDMVPKIADFGVSRCFGEKQTRAITSNCVGSQGYMAPEYFNGEITFKSDIYSLGTIILEILTGQKGYPEINNVLDSWNSRLGISQVDKQLEHVRVCLRIGIDCIDPNPAMRPATWRIIEMLDELERSYGFIETDHCTSLAPHQAKDSTEMGQGTPKVPREINFERAPAMRLATTSCVVFRYLGVPPGPQDCILYARGTRTHRNRWMTVTVAAQSHLGNHSGLRVAICPRQTNVCFVRCSSHAHAMLLHGHSTLVAGHDVVSFTRVLNLELLREDEDPGHLVHIRHIK